MIAYLKGVLTTKNPTTAIIECGGVGYEVQIPLSTYDKLPPLENSVKLLVHYAFSDTDGVRLFGFFSSAEKALFKKLISISKIGPKTALSVLSTLPAEELILAVQTGDVKIIATVPGIGKKSAERLIVELKDKVGSIDNFVGASELARTGNSMLREAEDALLALGYKLPDLRRALRQLAEDNNWQSSEQIVKAVIKELYNKR
ncbi:MAG: Holliday junction branch migration protein RuvA [Candidatus Cloacimonadales bacterium]